MIWTSDNVNWSPFGIFLEIDEIKFKAYNMKKSRKNLKENENSKKCLKQLNPKTAQS